MVLFISSLASALLISAPLISEYMSRNSSNDSPMETGSFLVYHISADLNQYNTSNASAHRYSTPSGDILIKTKGSLFSVFIEIFNGLHTKSFYENYSLSAGNPFLSLFIRNVYPTKDSIIQVDQLSFLMNTTSTYYDPLSSNSNNFSTYKNDIGFTTPITGAPLDVNESTATELGQIPNTISYDRANGYGILTLLDFTGSWNVLSYLFNSTGIYVTNLLNIELIATNIALQPLDTLHYLSENVLFGVIIEISSITYLYVVISIAKKANSKIRKRK